ncbi:hypothetical protein TWF225_011670 [Orbilia oligospora]|nr:hypothetical protein TWF225_011670 [Orbilia oligospora]KAF3244090.1 hypothetical protein TWF128_009795 [Orbilia oligospora]KAF3244629.1 hypothetical protein TWF217_010677 [Orbilia oligospora]KAF3295443.1 hypothetical protein TWF132_001492 [Orbilia oligospora]
MSSYNMYPSSPGNRRNSYLNQTSHHTRQLSTSSVASGVSSAYGSNYSTQSIGSMPSQASTNSSVPSVSRYNTDGVVSSSTSSYLNKYNLNIPSSPGSGSHYTSRHHPDPYSPLESPVASPTGTPTKGGHYTRNLGVSQTPESAARRLDFSSNNTTPRGSDIQGYYTPSATPTTDQALSNAISEITLSERDPSTRRMSQRPTSMILTGASGVATSADLKALKNSSVSHLRTLSETGEQIVAATKAHDVVGLHGRKAFKKMNINDGRNNWSSVTWMDAQRKYLKAYEYLCHIGEAKEWIERCIDEEIPPIIELENYLRNGITLARVTQVFAPELVPRIFTDPKLQYRHTDNIVRFFKFIRRVELPEVFYFELTDLYDKKNIPKVIYCIHALSYLLLRLGFTDFSIGNLVGQLEFTEEELHSTQRGLDQAGVSLPSFRGVGKHFDEEPQETEEERIQRELEEVESEVIQLQSAIRGALIRVALGWMMDDLWSCEPEVLDLQSRIRGMFARESFAYTFEMSGWASDMQALVRGLLIRKAMEDKKRLLKRNSKLFAKLQSIQRGQQVREGLAQQRKKLEQAAPAVTKLQSAIRGALFRNDLGAHMDDIYEGEADVSGLQAQIRGMLTRKALADQEAELQQANKQIAKLQAIARGVMYRSRKASVMNKLQAKPGSWEAIQARARGILYRRKHAELKRRLQTALPSIIKFQAAIRGASVRHDIMGHQDELYDEEEPVVDLQSSIRGMLTRKAHQAKLTALNAQVSKITELQARGRGALMRGTKNVFVAEMITHHEEEVTGLQACIRAALARKAVRHTVEAVIDEEPEIVDVQSLIRGALQRKVFHGKLQHYRQNMDKVIKLQSFVRAKQQGEAYRSLMSGKNPPVGTVKNFVHLLNDSDFDFDEEMEFESKRKTVVQHIRQNELQEQYIEQLDVKIGLLIRNKITLDEVIKYQKLGGHHGVMLGNTELGSSDPFDLKALNKNSRRKLELYQILFFALQTQPVYLSRMFQRVRQVGTAEKDLKRLENLIIGLFGYAQKRREEYYLLKLIAKSIRDELDASQEPQDYLRGNFFWSRLVVNYIRSPRDRKYMRDFLGPILKGRIVDNDALDLESNPLQIYMSSINNEELSTGRKSQRRRDITPEEAIRDPDTRKEFVQHLEELRDLCDSILDAIEENAARLPYGVRHLAQVSHDALLLKFPQEHPDGIMQVVVHFFFLKYFNPVILSPETFGIIDRSLAPAQKKNLTILSKVLSNISAGKLFSHGEDVYLQPMNNYMNEAIGRLLSIFRNIIQVPNAEKQFDMDEFDDLTSRQKPTLFIKMADIFALHAMVSREMDFMAPEREDPLRDLVRELGNVKNTEMELASVSSSEICLTLDPRLSKVEDPESNIKALFTETKRCVLYIIRVQTGTDLMDILVKPVTDEDEYKWQQVIAEDAADTRKRAAYSDHMPNHHTLSDISLMTYSELKKTALENVLKLEKTGKITRKNQFQDLLNAIAIDIRTKHRRRVQRQRELDGVKQTLSHLGEKARFLDDKLQSYNDYIEQAMLTLQTKKGKKKTILPFTKQYFHLKELQRSGRVPKFGSYKYSAHNLFEKGVLVSMEGYHHYDKINFTLSSDEVGVFLIEVSQGAMMLPGGSAKIPLDDLLQAQYNNHQFMTLFEGMCKLNVNLFLHLLFKKFYKDG